MKTQNTIDLLEEAKQRRKKIVALRQSDPKMTLQAIGNDKEVGLSRERVRQILNDEGLPSSGIDARRIIRYCIQCGKELKGKIKSFCNKDCISAYHNNTFVCEACGKTFTRPKSYNIRKGVLQSPIRFCNRKCLGAWMGRQNKKD